jgi:hypothetical protein
MQIKTGYKYAFDCGHCLQTIDNKVYYNLLVRHKAW